MNGLMFELKRSLAELDLGLKGDLSISEPMEALMNALYDDKVPKTWNAKAYPSMRPLGPWLSDVRGPTCPRAELPVCRVPSKLESRGSRVAMGELSSRETPEKALAPEKALPIEKALALERALFEAKLIAVERVLAVEKVLALETALEAGSPACLGRAPFKGSSPQCDRTPQL